MVVDKESVEINNLKWTWMLSSQKERVRKEPRTLIRKKDWTGFFRSGEDQRWTVTEEGFVWVYTHYKYSDHGHLSGKWLQCRQPWWATKIYIPSRTDLKPSRRPDQTSHDNVKCSTATPSHSVHYISMYFIFTAHYGQCLRPPRCLYLMSLYVGHCT